MNYARKPSQEGGGAKLARGEKAPRKRTTRLPKKKESLQQRKKIGKNKPSRQRRGKKESPFSVFGRERGAPIGEKRLILSIEGGEKKRKGEQGEKF